MNVREVWASDAKARLARLLYDVGHGATIVITRHGRAIAHLVPEVDRRRVETDGLLAAPRTLPRFPADEIRSMIDESRRR